MAVRSPLPCSSLLLSGLAAASSSPQSRQEGRSVHPRLCFSPSPPPPFHDGVHQGSFLLRSSSSSYGARGRPGRNYLCSQREIVDESLVTESSNEEKPSLSISRRQVLGAAVLVADVPGFLQNVGPWAGAPALAVESPGAKIPMICPEGSTVKLSIEGNCGLGVSVYPDFVYNPEGGGGCGSAADVEGDRIRVKFDPTTLYIPSVQFQTTKFLGLPLPPPLRIDIVSNELQGFIDRATGKVELNFDAEFSFSAGPLYHAPPLLVNTVLTTERTEGTLRSAQGQRMDEYGRCRLVGVARIQPIDDVFLTNFLMLPTDVLAELPATFEIIPPEA